MAAKLHINLSQGLIDVEGDPALVEKIYDDLKDVLSQRLASAVLPPEETPSAKETRNADEASDVASDAEPKRKTRSRVKRTGPSCAERIRGLKADGFFNELRDTKEVKSALSEKGHNYETKNVSASLGSMTKAGELRRIKKENIWKYQIP